MGGLLKKCKSRRFFSIINPRDLLNLVEYSIENSGFISYFQVSRFDSREF